jgi:hypothetical protein
MSTLTFNIPVQVCDVAGATFADTGSFASFYAVNVYIIIVRSNC